MIGSTGAAEALQAARAFEGDPRPRDRGKAKIKTLTVDPDGPRRPEFFVDELHELGRLPAAAKVLLCTEGRRQAIPEGFLVIRQTQSSERRTGLQGELETGGDQ